MIDFKGALKSVLRENYKHKRYPGNINDSRLISMINSGTKLINDIETLPLSLQIVCYSNTLRIITTFATDHQMIESLSDVNWLDFQWQLYFIDNGGHKNHAILKPAINNISFNGYILFDKEYIPELGVSRIMFRGIDNVNLPRAINKHREYYTNADLITAIDIPAFSDHVYAYWESFKNAIAPTYMKRLPDEWDRYGFYNIRSMVNTMLKHDILNLRYA